MKESLPGKQSSRSQAWPESEVRKATEAVRERMKGSTAVQDLGFFVERVEHARAIFQMPVTKRHLQIHDVVHGGIIATLADTVAAIAAFTTVPRGTEIATIEMKINFLEAVHGGTVRAEARVLRTGRNFVVVECDVHTEEGALAAKALLTFGAVSDRVAANLKKPTNA
jgi:uncharacterized protein (TIGR00369 family)